MMEEPVSTPRRRLPWWVFALAFMILTGFLALLGLELTRSMQGPITVGQTVPAYSVTTFDGQSFQSGDLAGKVVVLNFWASWCTPCEQEAEELEQAWQIVKPGGQVVFLGLAYVDTEPKSKEYLKRFKITYPNGPDLGTKVSQMFRIRGVPETYFIGRDGRLAYVQIGPFTSVDEVVKIINQLLK